MARLWRALAGLQPSARARAQGNLCGTFAAYGPRGLGAGETIMTQHGLVASEKAGARHFRVELQSPDARDHLRSSRLVLAGIIAVFLLAALFLWGTITAIQRIDAKGIESERNRAMVAVGLFQQTGRSMDGAAARKIGRDYVLENALLTAPASVGPEETYIPLAGT